MSGGGGLCPTVIVEACARGDDTGTGTRCDALPGAGVGVDEGAELAAGREKLQDDCVVRGGGWLLL